MLLIIITIYTFILDQMDCILWYKHIVNLLYTELLTVL